MTRIPKTYARGILVLVLLLMLTAPLAAKDINGTLTSVDPYYHSVTMLDEHGDQRTFRVAVDAQVFIDDEESTVYDLRPRDRVAVGFAYEEEEMVATVIRCMRD